MNAIISCNLSVKDTIIAATKSFMKSAASSTLSFGAGTFLSEAITFFCHEIVWIL